MGRIIETIVTIHNIQVIHRHFYYTQTIFETIYTENPVWIVDTWHAG